jgi:hypothetical protein
VITTTAAIAGAGIEMSAIRGDGHCRRHHAALDEVRPYAEPQQNRQEQNARPVPAPTLHGVANMTTSAAISKPIQTFWWRGEQIACGTMSSAALETLMAGFKVRCEVVERDRHGRQVYSPRVDIGRRLVSGALAYRRYSRDYVGAENEARKAKRGMWRGTLVKPWEWRVTARCGQASTPSAPAGSRRQAT